MLLATYIIAAICSAQNGKIKKPYFKKKKCKLPDKLSTISMTCHLAGVVNKCNIYIS